MIAHGLAVPPSLDIILFSFKENNIHYVSLTIQSIFGYPGLEITYTLPTNSCWTFLVGWLHYTEQGLRKGLQALRRAGLVQEFRKVRRSQAVTTNQPRQCPPDLIDLSALHVFILTSLPANCSWCA